MYDLATHLGKLKSVLESQGRAYDANTIQHAIAEIERLSAVAVGVNVGVFSLSSNARRVVVRDCANCSDQPTIPPDCPSCKGAGGFTTMHVLTGPASGVGVNGNTSAPSPNTATA